MRRSRRAPRVAAGALCALLVACGAREETGAPAPRSPAPAGLRVVSLLPAASAFALDLGAGAALVAVDPASARLPELASHPVVALEAVPELRPDLVLVPALSAVEPAVLERLRAAGSEVIEVAPRDYDDVFALCRDLGARLADPARAVAFEAALGRELGALAAAVQGRRRPRVAAVLGLEPLELASAHSFATDLIELAGGTSTTHDHTQPTPPRTLDELAASAPDLVLVVSAEPLAAPAQSAARSLLAGTARIEFFVLDTRRFWVRDSSDAVLRLRALIEPLAASPSPPGTKEGFL